jgi:hypothetical protein
MSKTLEERVAALESVIAGIRAAFGPAAISTAIAHKSEGGEVADDALLAKEWADMEIRKDPPRTSQASSVGKRMSECTPEYLDDYASFHDWKAKKGREENPPRLNNRGKPWYESDELTAKVARGWAARARKAKPIPFVTKANPPAAFDEPEDLPF